MSRDTYLCARTPRKLAGTTYKTHSTSDDWRVSLEFGAVTRDDLERSAALLGVRLANGANSRCILCPAVTETTLTVGCGASAETHMLSYHFPMVRILAAVCQRLEQKCLESGRCAFYGLACKPANGWRSHCEEEHAHEAWAITQELERLCAMPWLPPGLKHACPLRCTKGSHNCSAMLQRWEIRGHLLGKHLALLLSDMPPATLRAGAAMRASFALGEAAASMAASPSRLAFGDSTPKSDMIPSASGFSVSVTHGAKDWRSLATPTRSMTAGMSLAVPQPAPAASVAGAAFNTNQQGNRHEGYIPVNCTSLHKLGTDPSSSLPHSRSADVRPDPFTNLPHRGASTAPQQCFNSVTWPEAVAAVLFKVSSLSEHVAAVNMRVQDLTNSQRQLMADVAARPEPQAAVTAALQPLLAGAVAASSKQLEDVRSCLLQLQETLNGQVAELQTPTGALLELNHDFAALERQLTAGQEAARQDQLQLQCSIAQLKVVLTDVVQRTTRLEAQQAGTAQNAQPAMLMPVLQEVAERTARLEAQQAASATKAQVSQLGSVLQEVVQHAAWLEVQRTTLVQEVHPAGMATTTDGRPGDTILAATTNAGAAAAVTVASVIGGAESASHCSFPFVRDGKHAEAQLQLATNVAQLYGSVSIVKTLVPHADQLPSQLAVASTLPRPLSASLQQASIKTCSTSSTSSSCKDCNDSLQGNCRANQQDVATPVHKDNPTFGLLTRVMPAPMRVCNDLTVSQQAVNVAPTPDGEAMQPVEQRRQQQHVQTYESHNTHCVQTCTADTKGDQTNQVVLPATRLPAVQQTSAAGVPQKQPPPVLDGCNSFNSRSSSDDDVPPHMSLSSTVTPLQSKLSSAHAWSTSAQLPHWHDELHGVGSVSPNPLPTPAVEPAHPIQANTLVTNDFDSGAGSTPPAPKSPRGATMTAPPPTLKVKVHNEFSQFSDFDSDHDTHSTAVRTQHLPMTAPAPMLKCKAAQVHDEFSNFDSSDDLEDACPARQDITKVLLTSSATPRPEVCDEFSIFDSIDHTVGPHLQRASMAAPPAESRTYGKVSSFDSVSEQMDVKLQQPLMTAATQMLKAGPPHVHDEFNEFDSDSDGDIHSAGATQLAASVPARATASTCAISQPYGQAGKDAWAPPSALQGLQATRKAVGSMPLVPSEGNSLEDFFDEDAEAYSSGGHGSRWMPPAGVMRGGGGGGVSSGNGAGAGSSFWTPQPQLEGARTKEAPWAGANSLTERATQQDTSLHVVQAAGEFDWGSVTAALSTMNVRRGGGAAAVEGTVWSTVLGPDSGEPRTAAMGSGSGMEIGKPSPSVRLYDGMCPDLTDGSENAFDDSLEL